MENRLFRQKSLERINSPEQLHDYMRVTSPRIWMILGAVMILLIGFIVYASTATMENTTSIRVTADSYDQYDEVDGEIVETGQRSTAFTSTLPISMKDIVTTGMTVRIGTERGKIDMIAVFNDANDSEKIMLLITMDNPKLLLPDGEYDAELLLESTTPISFLWN